MGGKGREGYERGGEEQGRTGEEKGGEGRRREGKGGGEGMLPTLFGSSLRP